MLNKWSWLTFRSSKTVSIYDHFIKPLLSSIQHVKDSLKWNHYSDIGALLLIDSYPTDLRRFCSLLSLPGMCEERWWLFRIKWRRVLYPSVSQCVALRRKILMGSVVCRRWQRTINVHLDYKFEVNLSAWRHEITWNNLPLIYIYRIMFELYKYSQTCLTVPQFCPQNIEPNQIEPLSDSGLLW